MSRLAIIFSLLFVTPAWAELVLYCQDELATGIYKEKESWKTSHFEPTRHTVKFDDQKMTLSGLGWQLKCRMRESAIPEIIYCDGKKGELLFHFNKKSLKYSLYHVGSMGYIFEWNYISPDITMSHGTCQKF